MTSLISLEAHYLNKADGNDWGQPLTKDKLSKRLKGIFCTHRQITLRSFVIISLKSVIIYQRLMSKEVYYACNTIYPG